MRSNKKNVLFLMQLPPPIHGASVVNKSIQSSKLINDAFNCHFVDISPASDMSDLGKFSIRKVFKTVNIFIRSVKSYLNQKPNLVYMTLSPHGLAFFKDALILCALKLLGGKVVVHLHGKGIHKVVSKSSILKKIYQLVFKNVDIIHLAKSLFNDVNSVRDNNKKILEVNNGVEDVNKPEHFAESNKVKFLYLSNFVPTKGADRLVEAINLLPQSYISRCEFNLVGKVSDSFYYESLQKNVKADYKVSVNFLGPLYGEEKYKILSTSDVFVLPTRFKNECFPLSILEAMSFGLPVISTYEGAIPDIVRPNEFGFLFSSSDAQALSDLIKYYIDNPLELKSHAKQSRCEFVQRYTKRSFENKFIETLDYLVNT